MAELTNSCRTTALHRNVAIYSVKWQRLSAPGERDRLNSQSFEAYYKKHATIRFQQCLQATYNTSSQTEKSRGAIAVF
ncbi:hypothetical protein H6F90_13210 [Trichocoleus sp. FACHB-591]|uniref:hypothetical protein n=1 Tax=Trichocoleus sp. FACHB-591 TaxID=2692872 RepID=UPI001684903C|nr:hypothetical protein [Trichocoleus sp. FACHB-591]MBD2096101.1 hypothetical protein [Trichocoleus sp. FACHB-591]